MRICFLGIENLPVLAPEFRHYPVGGAQVQQTLLARALARAGHEVAMVVGDYGQPDGACWDGVVTYKACGFEAGMPVIRFVHPRWTSIWSALRRADAELYYTSCAGMQVGLLAAFCMRRGRRFVFRVASDSDCDPSRLLVRYARDRWLYRYGLRRADAVLVQSTAQGELLNRHFALPCQLAGSLVGEPGTQPPERDIDVLWVGNLRELKRPARLLELAERLPDRRFHMVGGAMPGEQQLFEDIRRRAAAADNVVFHGRLPYVETNALHARAKVLVNTSDFEGFPNTYLQSWIRGTPVVACFDPDGVIAREGLGTAVRSTADLPRAVAALLDDAHAWNGASRRCRKFMEREYNAAAMLRPYLDTFEALLDTPRGSVREPAARSARQHV